MSRSGNDPREASADLNLPALLAEFDDPLQFEGVMLFGSGAGTYESLAPGYQDRRDELIANHAHDDYAEVLATTGAVGFLAGFVPLLGGFAALARMAFGAHAQASWRRRAFARAALTSIAIALAHALVDFNFYIPANPATLAAIAGAAVALREP